MKIIKVESNKELGLKYLTEMSVSALEIKEIDVSSETGQLGPETYYIGQNHVVNTEVEVCGKISLNQDNQSLDQEAIKTKVKADLLRLNSEGLAVFLSSFDVVGDVIDLIREQESSVKGLKVEALFVSKVSVPTVYESAVKIVFDLEVTFFEPGDPSVVNQEWSKAWNASRRPI